TPLQYVAAEEADQLPLPKECWEGQPDSRRSTSDKWKHCMIGGLVAKDGACGQEMAKYLAWQNECNDAHCETSAVAELADALVTIYGSDVPAGTNCETHCNKYEGA